MKHSLFILLLLVGGVCVGQKKDSLPPLYLGRERKGDYISTFEGKIDTSITVHYRQLDPGAKTLFFGKEINNELMRFDIKGNMYIKPSFFCKCDKRDSLIFIWNFFNSDSVEVKSKQ